MFKLIKTLKYEQHSLGRIQDFIHILQGVLKNAAVSLDISNLNHQFICRFLLLKTDIHTPTQNQF